MPTILVSKMALILLYALIYYLLGMCRKENQNKAKLNLTLLGSLEEMNQFLEIK